MGYPPPPDAPPPEAQKTFDADASFAPSPSGASLCGFSIPGFEFNASLRLPQLPTLSSLAFPPPLMFALPIRCPLAEEPAPGPGRAGTTGLNDDPEYG